MRRATPVIALGALAISLALTACGGSPAPTPSPTSSDAITTPTGSASPPATDDARRATLLGKVREDAIAAGAKPDEVECVIGILSRLSTEDLQLLNDASSNDVTQAAVEEAAAKCFTS